MNQHPQEKAGIFRSYIEHKRHMVHGIFDSFVKNKENGDNGKVI